MNSELDLSLPIIGFNKSKGKFITQDNGSYFHKMKSGIRIHAPGSEYVNNRPLFWFPFES